MRRSSTLFSFPVPGKRSGRSVVFKERFAKTRCSEILRVSARRVPEEKAGREGGLAEVGRDSSDPSQGKKG